jgi:c-di-GMP-binding flagellar brake protein YcgR
MDRSAHRPETDAEMLEQYRVPDHGERSRLLSELVTAGDMVTLHADGTHDCFVVSKLLAVDTARDTVEFEFTTDEERHATFKRSGRAVAVALLARVKLQFDLSPIAVESGAGRQRLHAALPRSMSRLQRRDAYRVAPPVESTARLWLSDPQAESGERRVQVLDVSANGLGLGMSAQNSDLPAVGDLLQGCRLELPGFAPIRCTLSVRAVAPAPEGGRGGLRIGCEFSTIDAHAARAVQMYVNAAQTRGRRLRPKIG